MINTTKYPTDKIFYNWHHQRYLRRVMDAKKVFKNTLKGTIILLVNDIPCMVITKPIVCVCQVIDTVFEKTNYVVS